MLPPAPALWLRSPEETSRRIALRLLDDACAASLRLDDAGDAEALHDFRVAVRRLRSTLRAWREFLRGSVKKKHRRALRALQLATGAGRDAEVAVAWLEGQREGMPAGHRRALAWMIDRLGRRHEAAMGQARGEVRAAFERIEGKLRRALEVMHVEVDLSTPAPRRTASLILATKVRDHAVEVVQHLSRVACLEDRDEAHRARITGKRLRYLVEPLRGEFPLAARIVKRAKKLQDVLGDLNDAHVLRAELGSALEEEAVQHARRLNDLMGEGDAERVRQEVRRSLRPGLIALTRRVQEHAQQLFERLRATWLEEAGAPLVEACERLARDLEHHARAGVEIERKYLLRGRPELPPAARAVEIEQGWLPGKHLRERLRRVQSANGLRHLRTVKLGAGVERTELEEETTAEVFAALWPLTEGCRVHKRRHVVDDGDRTWEIDEFLDRDLFLAEVELESAEESVELPAWLEPHVVRDVTGEEGYTNLRLAR